MKMRSWAVAAMMAVGCAPATQGPMPEPAPPPRPPAEAPPPPPPAPPAPATPAPAPPVSEAPRDWHLQDAANDAMHGASVTRAYREVLAGREPVREVVVAVIDGGVDTAHVDLRANLWRNEDERAGNGVDDDGNGYVDDVYGWNFIGGAQEDVHWDTFEVTRLYAQCTGEGTTARPANCEEIVADYEERRTQAEQLLVQLRQISANLEIALPMLRGALGNDTLTVEAVQALRPTSPDVGQARAFYLALANAGITPKDVEEGLEAYETQLEYNLDPGFDPRAIVGDEYGNVAERVYGNADVMGPDADHGTHVAGIIAAVRGNDVGIDGIAPAVRIMTLRAVPDGDERDKDVANAIRYAADNGAHIINMSFGKSHSPQKGAVDEAVKYAESKGVLLIHAAGNDGEDLAVAQNFPNRMYADGSSAANWIEVGASSWKAADSLAAPFSNYGSAQVDLFAPGVDILSTMPGDAFEAQDGTSMAAPVVTGVAALLMAYHPQLTAADVKRILLETATPHRERTVLRPGAGDPVQFGTLSVTGGVVNALEALRMADRMRQTF